MKEKQCKKCLNTFPATLEYFYKNNKNSDGLYSYCKKCAIKKSGEWTHENRERHLASKSKYNKTQKSKEKMRRINKRRSENGYHLEWQRQNKVKVKDYQEKRKLHKNHDISNEELDLLYDYCNYSCMYCGILESESILKYNQRLHKDHAYNDGSNGIDNCILACKSCNSSKHTTNWEEWYNSSEVYSQDKYEKILSWLNMWKQQR